MQEKIYDYVLLDVFTSTRMEGNPLAVFPHAHGISDNHMQRIAAELNLSETVFLVEPDDGNSIRRARIFTPRRELDFAGHPTIGSAFVIHREHAPGDSFAIQENVGSVPIESDAAYDEGGALFWLTTPEISFFEEADANMCARLLALSPDDLASNPPQYVSAGSPLLFIHVKTPEIVDRAELRQEILPYALGSANSVGTFVFARKEPLSEKNFDVYSRMFAPQTGIPEDPATGGATGPLAAYMLRHGLIPAGTNVRFVSEQGKKMGRRSLLHVNVCDADRPVIKIGGSAVAVASGQFTLDA